MDLGFLQEYYIPVVLVACLIVGYCIKHITCCLLYTSDAADEGRGV